MPPCAPRINLLKRKHRARGPEREQNPFLPHLGHVHQRVDVSDIAETFPCVHTQEHLPFLEIGHCG